MTSALWVLAVLAVIGGLMGVPDFFVSTFTGESAHINWLHGWLVGVTHDSPLILSYAVKWILLALAIVVAVSAVVLAYKVYDHDRGVETDAAIAKRFGGLYELWSDKYNVDEIYETMVINPLVKVSDRVLAVFDIKIVDGFVNFIGAFVRFFGGLFRYFQTGVTQNYAFALVLGVVMVLGMLIFG
jgi:NADH-quinone oxidoreductase subunit L